MNIIKTMQFETIPSHVNKTYIAAKVKADHNWFITINVQA